MTPLKQGCRHHLDGITGGEFDSHAGGCPPRVLDCLLPDRQITSRVPATPALFTQRLCIISAAKARHFSAFVCSRWTKQHWRTATPVCHFTQLTSTVDPKGVKVHILKLICVFPPGVHLLISPSTVYNHMDAVNICCDWDPDTPCILEVTRLL